MLSLVLYANVNFDDDGRQKTRNYQYLK